MKDKAKLLILLAVSGVATGLSVAFARQLGFLIWVSMIPLFFALKLLTEREDLKLRHAYLYGLFYFECFGAVCFHFFFFLYPLDFTGINNFYSVIVIILACFGLSFLKALFGGFVFIIYAFVARGRLVKKYPALSAISFAALYSFYEFTETLGWWGVPWGRISLAPVNAVIPIQAASLFGSYFITAVIVSVNFLLGLAIAKAQRLENGRKYAVAALSVFTVNLALGTVLYFVHKGAVRDNDSVTVGVIQGNYSSADKWMETPKSILDRHVKLTEMAAEDGAQIVLFAETALPFAIYENDYYGYRLSNLADVLDITIVVGAMSTEEENDYNALLAFGPDGKMSEEKYYKRHLVPFGEYVPMRNTIEKLLPFMSEISMLSDDVTHGTEGTVFTLEGTDAGALICFDSIYEDLTRDTVREGAEIILLSTNDSWFSDSSAIYIHNDHARMRAVEFGRYIARSANTGLSSFITNTGEVTGELEPLTEGYLCAKVTNASHRTLYSIIGNAFVYLCGASVSVLFTYELISKLKANKSLQNGD